ncbi:hypothetical protein DFH06DRAFT_1019686 [Mycena polygramma]|nr:hypothetical protein DFH06DRAFT_1019686 [Mycena polygramma]
MVRVTTISAVPDLMLIGISYEDLLVDPVLTFQVEGHTETMKLRGLIYHSALDVHFTSIVVDNDGALWYHDGISTRRNTVNHGNIAALPTLRDLHWYKNQRLCAAIYAKV